MKYRKFISWMKKERNSYLVIGVFFILLQFAIFYANAHVDNYGSFFWFCNHAPLIFGIAFLTKKPQIIKALVSVGFLIQFTWTIDFLSRLFFGAYIFKVTRYVFEGEMGRYVLIPIFAHMFSTNLAFAMTYKYKPKIKTLLYSLVYGLFLFAMTLTYTPIEKNVNCIQVMCGIPQYTFANYPFFWPLILFFVIILPTQGIQYLVYLHSRRKRVKVSEQ